MFIKAQVCIPVHALCKRYGEPLFTIQMAIDITLRTRGHIHISYYFVTHKISDNGTCADLNIATLRKEIWPTLIFSRFICKSGSNFCVVKK